MNIREIRPESGPGSIAPIQPARSVHTRDGARNTPEGRDREDLVEISDEARALAAQADVAAEGSLDADRILELRRWIQAGGYDAPEVVDRIARRLLELGEV